jgi:hypothetical protein
LSGCGLAAAVHEAVILQLSVSEQVKQVKPVELFGVVGVNALMMSLAWHLFYYFLL